MAWVTTTGWNAQLLFKVMESQINQFMDKKVKEIRAEQSPTGLSVAFLVIYEDDSAQRVEFTGEELQHWNLDPHLFTKMLWNKMHDLNLPLHMSLNEMEKELTDKDWQANKLFDQFKNEVENELNTQDKQEKTNGNSKRRVGQKPTGKPVKRTKSASK